MSSARPIRNGARAAAKTRPRTAVAANANSSAASRLSRQAWIDAAVARLSQDSVAALRVDDLAEQLGVTKGSFYWHFESREALLAAVLDWWRQLMTQQTTDILHKLTDSPRERIRRLISIAISPRPDVPGGPLELSLRDWARRDEAVLRIVREVDDAREAIVTELYRRAGLDEGSARDYAHAHLAYVIGDRMTSQDADPQELQRRRRIALALLLPPERPERSR